MENNNETKLWFNGDGIHYGYYDFEDTFAKVDNSSKPIKYYLKKVGKNEVEVKYDNRLLNDILANGVGISEAEYNS